MNNMPLKLRQECAADPFYRTCARQNALHDHVCEADPLTGRMIEWEHALQFGFKQVQKKYAIIGLCWWAHRGPGLRKEINEWIALSRATPEELASISKAISYPLRLIYLESKYGTYTPTVAAINGIAYPWLSTHTVSMWPEKLQSHIESYDRGSYLVASDEDPEVQHLVDFEGFEDDPVACSCEAFTLSGHRPCKHIRLAQQVLGV